MKKRNITFAILLLAVVCTAFGVSGTYARYITTDTGTGTARVAKWAVAFKNGEGTALGDNFTIALNQTPTSQQGVATGKIAPDSEVYGEVAIDLTGTEVDTDIFAELGEITGLTDSDSDDMFSVKVYKVVGTTVTPITKDTTTGKYIIHEVLNSGKTALTEEQFSIRVALVWANDDDYNTHDTANGVAYPQLSADLTLTAQQHIYGNETETVDKDTAA